MLIRRLRNAEIYVIILESAVQDGQFGKGLPGNKSISKYTPQCSGSSGRNGHLLNEAFIS